MLACSTDSIAYDPPRLPVDQSMLSNFYGEFREVARRALRRCGGALTLQPTDLAHEAVLRLLAGNGVAIRNEAHFLALGVRVIRVTLIDEIRRRNAAKRDAPVVTLWEEDEVAAPIDIEAFDGALDDLAEIDPDAAAVVQLRFYVGLTMEEIARELLISESTALRRWRLARAWLFKELRAAA